MKFYNPFKPHIVKEGELYFIRKLTVWGWAWGSSQYLGYNNYWTHSGTYKKIYCNHHSPSAARIDLGEIEEKLKKNKTEVIL